MSIASELLASPALLFLDEPTTGLDSSNAINVVRIAARVAARGTTVVMSIHQPRSDIFELFHRVVLMAKGGRTVYCGEAAAAAARLQAEVDATIGTIPTSPVVGVAANGHGVDDIVALATNGHGSGVIEGEATDGPTDGPMDGPTDSLTDEETDAVNPGDLILDLACGLHSTDLVRAFERSQDRAGMAETISSLATAGNKRLLDKGNTGFKTNSVAMFHVQVRRVARSPYSSTTAHWDVHEYSSKLLQTLKSYIYVFNEILFTMHRCSCCLNGF